MTKEERSRLVEKLNRIYGHLPSAEDICFNHNTCKWYVINGEVVHLSLKGGRNMLRELIDEVARGD